MRIDSLLEHFGDRLVWARIKGGPRNRFSVRENVVCDDSIEGSRSCGINDIIITPMVPAAAGAFTRR